MRQCDGPDGESIKGTVYSLRQIALASTSIAIVSVLHISAEPEFMATELLRVRNKVQL